MASADSAAEGARPSVGPSGTPAMLNTPRVAVRTAITKAIFRRAKTIYADGLITLSYLAEADWPEFRSGLRRYAVLRARADVIRRNLDSAYVIVLLALLLAGSIVVSAVLDYDRNHAIILAVGCIAFFIAMAIESVIAQVAPPRMPRVCTLAVMVGVPAVITIGLLEVNGHGLHLPWQVLPKHGSRPADIITGGLAVCAAQMAIIAVCAVLIEIIDSAVNASFVRHRPDIMVTGTLINLLRNLHVVPRRFDTIHTRRLVCRDLEQAAVYLQTRLPAALRISDPVTKQELQQTFDDSAAFLRQQQVRVVLSEAATVSELPPVVARYIAVFTLGAYGYLPTAEPLSRRQVIMATVSRLIKTVIVAAIPIVCLTVARHYGVTLSGRLNNWAVLVALLWAVISLVSLAGPAYRGKLDERSSMLSVLRKNQD